MTAWAAREENQRSIIAARHRLSASLSRPSHDARSANAEPEARSSDASGREERIAENEAVFRLANERMAAWEERDRAAASEPYFCECANPECTEKVMLRGSDYERVRRNSSHFFVVPGHEIPDGEIVIEKHEGWLMVEKDPNVSEIVEDREPRRP